MTAMSRVSATRRAPTRGWRRRPRATWPAALTWCGAAALVLLGVFLAHPLLEGHRLPLGPDAPVYVWWARFVDVEGLEAVRRSGAPALILPLTTLLFAQPLQVVAALEPALAMSVGLAGGALVEAALGPDPVRFAAASLLVGAFAGLLAAGWLANLVLAALFLAALAAFALAERSWRPVAFAGACLAAAGIAHSLFLAVALAIVAGTALMLAPGAFHRIRAGERPLATDAMRLSAGAAAGGGVALLALGVLAGGTAAPGDTSQDQVFRGLGMRETLTRRYRERAWGEARRIAVPAVGAAVGAVWLGRLPGERSRFAGALAASWIAITVVGVGVLWATGLAPPGRLLTFAYVLPLVTAAGVAVALRRNGWMRLAGLAAAAAIAATSLWGWYRQAPFMSEREVRSVEAVAPFLDDLPAGTPIVVAVDTGEFAAAFHVARFGNVIRAGLPAERIGDAHLFVGGPEDVLAGRPGTRSEDPEYRGLAEAYLERVRPVLDEAAILVLAPFNPQGFPEARRLGRPVSVDAVLLRAPEGVTPRAAASPPSDVGISPATWAGLAALASLMLALLGGGWAAWGLPGAGPLAALGAAPAAGLGVLILAALAADRLSLPAAGGGAVLAGAMALLGYLLAARYSAIEEAEQTGA